MPLCSVFILPPGEEELVRRINVRGDMERADLELRLKNSKEECSVASEFKYCLTNDNFDVTSSILRFIVEKEIGL